MSKTVPFQTIQFSPSTQFSSIRSIDRTLSVATTLGLSGPRSDGNEGLLCIPLNSSITRTSLSDCFVSYPGHCLELGVLSLCREAVSVFYSPSRLGKALTEFFHTVGDINISQLQESWYFNS